jgi:hypothetical protein
MTPLSSRYFIWDIIQTVIEVPHSRDAIKIPYRSRPPRYRFRRRRYTTFLLLINP